MAAIIGWAPLYRDTTDLWQAMLGRRLPPAALLPTVHPEWAPCIPVSDARTRYTLVSAGPKKTSESLLTMSSRIISGRIITAGHPEGPWGREVPRTGALLKVEPSQTSAGVALHRAIELMLAMGLRTIEEGAELIREVRALRDHSSGPEGQSESHEEWFLRLMKKHEIRMTFPDELLGDAGIIQIEVD